MFFDDPSKSAGVAEYKWRDPSPLIAKTPAWPYPVKALPDTIRAAVIEVQAFTQAPMALVASSALAALSLAMQAHIDVRRAEKLESPASLFLLTIADSGERKSTCDGFFTPAIREYETRQAEAAKSLLKEFEAAKSAWTAREAGVREKIKSLAKQGKPTNQQETELRELQDQKPISPKIPKMLRGDETPENLAWALSQEWPSAGVVASEAGLVLGSHGMGKESVMRNLAQLNVLWDGGKLSIGRRTSQSFVVSGARLTMALQVQEPTLRSFFGRSGGLARGSGFLARFLIAWPESTQGSRRFRDAPEDWPALASFNRRISEILNQPARMGTEGGLEPSMLSFAPDAKAAWVAFHDAVERDLATGGALFDVRDVASKSADNAARLAALFQMFEHGTGGTIGLEALTCANQIAGWHLNESRRFFGELALPVELENAVRLDAWLLAYCRRERTTFIPAQKIQQYGPSGLREKTALENATRILEELHRARMVRDGRTRFVTLNPKLALAAINGEPA